MSITIKKPTGGKLDKGRDHLLKCQLTWDDETHPDFTDSDVHLYVTMKANDAADDEAGKCRRKKCKCLNRKRQTWITR